MNTPEMAWVDGRLVPQEQATVSVLDRSFLYGDGLFETVGIRSGRPVFWSAHVGRLLRGLGFLGIRPPFTAEALREGADRLLGSSGVGRGVLRIHVSRGVGRRGYSPRGADRPLVVMTVHAAAEADPGPRAWRLHTASMRVAAGGGLASVKSASKLLQVLARAEAEAAGADEAVVLNTEERVAETSSGNLFWIREGRLRTPPVSEGALPGIARGKLLELAAGLGLSAEEAPGSLADLTAAEGVFLSLGSLGVVEATDLDGVPLGRSPWTRRLWEAYDRAASADVEFD